MHLTYVVAPMRCPRCGTVTDDETTRIETSLRPRGEPALIRVGEPVDEALLPRRHLTIRPPAPGEPVRALEFWSCPACGLVGWAEVVVEDGRVARVAPVTVDAATLRGVHYVTLSAGDELAARFGHPVSDGGVLRPGLVEELPHVLPPPTAADS
ncbi:MAG TPA: hypothetical protein VFT95_14595 [Micromonosporaceae bacterium]|nr:hypothetical protein [Micromonosporaceae bacterium]